MAWVGGDPITGPKWGFGCHCWKAEVSLAQRESAEQQQMVTLRGSYRSMCPSHHLSLGPSQPEPGPLLLPSQQLGSMQTSESTDITRTILLRESSFVSLVHNEKLE